MTTNGRSNATNGSSALPHTIDLHDLNTWDVLNDFQFAHEMNRAVGDWVYDTASNRYRNTKTGRYMTATDRLHLRDAVTDRYRAKMVATATKLAAEDISVAEFRKQFARQMKSTYVQQFAFGRGGVAQMTDADRAVLAGILDRQNRFLERFAEQIRDGDVSAAQLLNRSGMYADGATSAYESGLIRAFGDYRPPHVPGDGSTACGSRCRCSLEPSRTDAGLSVYWRLNARAEHCDDCKSRASTWNPLTLTAGSGDDDE